MSTDWNIPITEPLDVPALLETMRETFQELLNLSDTAKLYVDYVNACPPTEILPKFLDLDSGLLQIFYESQENWRTGVQLFVMDTSNLHAPPELWAVVSLTGGGDNTWYRFVTANACAIATARIAKSTIDPSGDPEQLMQEFRCRQKHGNYEAAYKAVYEHAEAYWAAYRAIRFPERNASS